MRTLVSPLRLGLELLSVNKIESIRLRWWPSDLILVTSFALVQLRDARGDRLIEKGARSSWNTSSKPVI